MPIASRSPRSVLVALCGLAAVLGVLAAGSASAEVTPPLTVRWTQSMGAQPQNTTVPLIVEGRVYITHLGAVRCLDALTGAEKWQFPAESGGVTTSPLADGDLIIVGAANSTLYGLNAETGEEVWRQGCAGPVAPDPIVLGGSLMLAGGEMVYSADPRSGKPSWVCALTSPAAAGPVSDGSMLYFLCQDGSLQSVDAREGRFRWRLSLGGGPSAFPLLTGGRRVIVTSGRTLVGVARSGRVAWTARMPASIGGRPTVVEDSLYVPCVDGEVHVLYARSGRSRRSASLQVDGAATAAPLVAGNLVLAGTSSGLIYALARDSGEAKWIYRCRAPEQEPGEAARFGIYAPLLSGGGALYCLTGPGELYCFSASAPDAAGPSFSDLRPEPGDALPASPGLIASFAVVDDGSGVNGDSLTAVVDGTSYPVGFDVASGMGSIRLGTLTDGPHVVKVTARDYRGNEGSIEWSFLTDPSLAGPPPGQPTGPGWGTPAAPGVF